MKLGGSFCMGIYSGSLALIDLLVLMNADSLIKSSNMLSKMVVETMKIISEEFFQRRESTRTWKEQRMLLW